MRAQDTITFTGSATGDTPAANVTIPRELGSVRLLREIGRGGMGVVYLGRHQMLDRDVAVKFLLNAVAGPDDPDFAGFLEGARAAARLEHPGLTTIHHADVVDGIPYLVMQYIDGPALSDVLSKTAPLSLSASLAILDAVSEAIGALHDRGIIHRDIKPGNVLLCPDGRVVVTDFGLSLARPMGRRGPSSARLGGTPVYMAPEMFAGDVSLRSDVYALGVMAFELLTGELPFTGTLEELREKHLHEPLPLDSLQRRGLDPPMIDVLERATRKNPMFRYKTTRQFLRALKDAITDSEAWSKGATELSALAAQCGTEPTEANPPESGSSSSDAYFDTLATVAAGKRTKRPRPMDAHHGVPEPISSTMSPRYRRLSRLIPEVALFETDEQRKAAMRQASSITARGSGRLWIWLLLFLMTLVIIPLSMRVTGLDVEWGRLQSKYPMVRLIYFPLMVLLMYSWLWFCRSVIRPRLREQLVAKGVPICVPCGYNLRGQLDPRCPECGTAFDEKLLNPSCIATEETPTSTYFDRLSEVADERRTKRVLSGEGSAGEPAQDDHAEAPPLSSDDGPVEVGSIPGPPSVELTRDAPLVADVSCTKCEYNLRGLSACGQCPECGEPVASSLRADRLLFASPKWLSTIALGQTLIFGTMIAIPILYVVALVVAALLGLGGVSTMQAMRLLVLASGAIVGGGIAQGVFMSTRREPALAAPKRTSVTARIARLCTLVGIPGIYAGTTVSSSSGGVSGPSTTLVPFGEFVQPIGLAACVIGCVSLLHYLRKLAERVPDAKLLRSSRQLATLLYVLVPLGLGCLALNRVFLSSDAPPETRLMFWAKLAVVIIPTALAAAAVLLCWFLMVAHRRSIKRVIAVAISYDTLFGDIPTHAVLPCAEHGITDGAESPSDGIP